MSASAIPAALRRQVLARDQARCCYRGLLQFGQGAVFHINHVVPRSKGGATQLENLALQCPHCSLHKSNLTAYPDSSGEPTPLFHPLRQLWHEHVSLMRTGEIRGLTPTGHATIAALHMNDLLPRIARKIQIGIGLLVPNE